MQNKTGIFGAVVVALLVSLAVYLGLPAIQNVASGVTGGSSGGAVRNVPDFYTNGIGVGSQVLVSKTVTIPAGKNQAAWKNDTGRSVVLFNGDTSIGWLSGTASSSWMYFVSTSTSATVTDYARPTGIPFPIDGVTTATSSGPSFVVGTTTATQVGFVVPAGSYLIFNVQERYACKTVGVCETATSTNRGVTNFIGHFVGHYLP